MRLTIPLTACLVFAGAVTAQEDALQAARAEYQALKAEYDAAMDSYYMASRRLTASADYKKASEAQDMEAISKLRASVRAPDKKTWIEKFQKAADRYAPAAGEVPFLAWLAVWSQDKDVATEVLGTIMERHAGSPDLLEIAEYVGVVRRTVGDELNAKVMDMLLASEHEMIKANALYTKGYALVGGREPSAEDLEQGGALLAECAKLVDGTTLALRARAPEFQRTRLQIGMEVPDIVGADLDGVPFKLSDYRGKVVVIDFWGDW